MSNDDVQQELNQKESDMESIIIKFLADEISIYEMKERLNLLEKDIMDVV